MPKYVLILLACFAIFTGNVARLYAEPQGEPFYRHFNSNALNRQDGDGEGRRNQIKAGFIINFASFTTWPPGAFADDEAPLVIMIVGSKEIARRVAELTNNKTISERRVVVYHTHTPPDTSSDSAALAAFIGRLQRSHVVFFADRHDLPINRILPHLAESPVLTIGDGRGFAKKGGMLGLVERERRIAFNANVEAIDAADLHVSSKVLRLAKIVRSN